MKSNWQKIILWGGVIIITLGLVYTKTSWNFTFLGVLAIALFCFIHVFPKNWDGKKLKNLLEIRNPIMGMCAALLLTIFSVMTLWTLRNYFYADKSVYTNNDHHALKITGVQIQKPAKFLLVKNNGSAFFDDKQFHGSVYVESVDTNYVTLDLRGFSHPIYRYNYSRNRIYKNVDSAINNIDNTISFTSEDKVKFVSGNGKTVEFWIEEDDARSFLGVFKGRDVANYFFKDISTGVVDTSNITSALVKGYSFNGLLSGVTNHNLDFNGISIVRAIAKPKAKNHERFDDVTATRYIIDINEWAYKQNNGENSIKEIIVGGNSYPLEDLKRLSHKIQIPLIKVKDTGIYKSADYYIGYGDAKTDIFSFQTDSSNAKALTINFKQPYYRNLYGVGGKEDNSLYVTASLVEDTDKEKDHTKGVGINVPYNVALFNIFNHSNNVHNFRQFNLYYKAGHTTENLAVLLHVKGDKEEGKIEEYRAGSKIKGIKSDSGLEWNFEIENLRETTPFSSQKMMWVVLFVCLASILVSGIHLLWHYETDSEYNNYHRYTFSYAEFLLHIILIYFVSFRCFLLWRTSVFIPLESISAYEWVTIFRPNSGFTHFLALIAGLFVFYFVLARVKILMLNCYRYGNYKGIENKTWVRVCSKSTFILFPLLLFVLGAMLFFFKKMLPLAGVLLVLAYICLEMYFSAKKKYYAYKRGKKDDINDNEIYKLLDNTFFRLCASKWIADRSRFLILQFTLYVIGFLTQLVNSRAALLVIVFTFFILEAIVYARSKFKSYKIKEVENKEDRMSLMSDFFFSVANMFLAAGTIFLIGDTGFLVMFGTFCLFAIGFKIQDLYVKLAGNKDQKKDLKNALSVVAYIFAVSLVLLFYKPIILWIVNSRYFISLFVLGLVVSYILICRFASVNPFKMVKPVILIIPVLVSLCVCIVAPHIDKIDFDGTVLSLIGDHTKQRVKVLDNKPEDILSKIENTDDELRFLQASYNHWIIEEYHRRSSDVSLWGEEGTGYFKIHPQSKLGALWNAQLTDIVLIRYVITEHSKILPLFFIFLLLIMLFQGIRKTTYYRFTRILLIQIPLLLFVQALLVWMANTQRFVFFGQDFPLLSVTPKLMLIYIFALFMLWVVAAILESVMYRKYSSELYPAREAYNKTQAWTVLVSMMMVVVGIFVFGEPDSLSNKDENKGDSKYTMGALLGKGENKGSAVEYFIALDDLFEQYQKSNKLVLMRDMYPQISKFNSAYKDTIDAMFKSIALASSDSLGYIFPKRVWENYVNGGSRNNSFNNLVHVRNKRVCSEETMKLRLEISLRSDYYDTKLPYHTDKGWKGNILEDGNTVTKDTAFLRNEHYNFYKFWDNWIKEGENTCMLYRISDANLEVYSIYDDSNVGITKDSIDKVVSLNNYDRVSLDSKVQQLPNGTHKYWARNIVVNGKSQFIYPQGKDMYWIRDFANVVKNVKDDNLKSEKTDDADVAVTLNRELTQAIYDIYENYKGDSQPKGTMRSVIIADGNGHIRAMVDHKKGYAINPNDEERINELTEDLYMNYSQNSINEERMWFQNRNLAHLALGPASTQKPLVWNAVASYAKMPWESVVLLGFQHTKFNPKPKTKPKTLKHYNGEPMQEFKYDRGDECDGADITPELFLKKSSNFYSALMVYLGLHKKEYFDDDADFLTLNRKKNKRTEYAFKLTSLNPKTIDSSKYCVNYPFLRIGNTNVQLDHKISGKDYDSSLLHYQMKNVYGLNDHLVSYSDTSRLKEYYYDTLLNKKNLKTIVNILPEASSLNFDLFKTNETLVNSGMRNIALGGYKYWSVTPFHMAEMFGKMVSMNTNYCLSYNPGNINDTIDWKPKNDKYVEQRSTMFKGMNDFFTNGTGTEIIKEGKTNVGQKTMKIGKDTNTKKTYYFYGKTGTATGQKIDVNYDGKTDPGKPRRLAIIISDTKLHYSIVDNKRVDAAGYKPKKFYVLYFTFDVTNSGFKDLSREIIEKVLESDVFKNYMNK